jgi:hypothetical protein
LHLLDLLDPLPPLPTEKELGYLPGGGSLADKNEGEL